MIDLIKCLKDISHQIYKNDLEDEISHESLKLLNLVEQYSIRDPGQNLVVLFSDQETYDVSGYIIFVDEDKLDEIVDGEYIPELLEDEEWIALGDPPS